MTHTDALTVTERNKIATRLFHDALDQGDLSVLEEHPGLTEMRGWFGAFRAAFPDALIVAEDLIAEGDWVAHRLTIRGVHAGEWQGCAPTGEEVVWQVIGMYQFADGIVVEARGQSDLGEMMRRARAPIAAGA